MCLLLAYLMFADWVWGPTNDPGQTALWKDGRQVGVWKSIPGEYLAFDGARFVSARCPIDPPENISPMKDPSHPVQNDLPTETVDPPPPRPKLADASRPGKPVNYGLDKSELGNDGELYQYNGESIDKAAAENLLAGGKMNLDRLTDDSQAIRLTVVGKDGKKTVDALKADPRWAELAEGVVAKSYPADHWIVRERGYKAISPDKPTLFLTAANGDLLYQGEEAGGLFDALRRRRDPFTINWNSWNFGVNPWTWMMGLGWSKLSIPVEFVLLVIGAIALSFLLARRKTATGVTGGNSQ